MSSVSTEIAPREVPFEWLWRWFTGIFGAVENWSVRLAARKGLAITAIAGATIVLRLALLPVLPIPVPEVHDEFSYLLAADTFAHGRLANPPHPMAQYLETFHVNQHPTYMSIYPPAQGAALAVGELLGNPWIGVLLSVAGLCAAVTWMLQGWIPARWALLGGILVMLRVGIFGYWMNSYWGGAVAAIGGALVIGALPRIRHFHRIRDAVILGLGASILANSRPFEGAIFCLPVFAILMVWLCGKSSPSWKESIPRIVAPLCAVLALCAAFMAYYNWRGTGHPLTFPYVLNVGTHLSVPQLAWQKVQQPFHFENPQFEAYYNVWWPSFAWSFGRPDSLAHIVTILWHDLKVFGTIFLWPELCIALIALPWALMDRKTRFLLIQICICFAGFLLVAVFQPHYSAPLVATAFAIIIQCMRHLRQWRIGAFPVGVGVARALFIAAVLMTPYHMDWSSPLPSRAGLERKLESMPGQHLVIIRYSPQHDVLFDWVYNGADVDDAKIVWAREIPGVSDKPLIDYFRGRQVWLVQPDVPQR